MKTQQPLLKISIKASANLENLMRFVGFNGNYAGAGAAALGVLDAATNQGEQAPVITYGVVLVEAGAAISAGQAIESDAQGRAVPRTTGVLLGYALDAASGGGEIIRIKLV
ncbi:MAG: DUF2190 family protein [Fervidobacterium pennivorans]